MSTPQQPMLLLPISLDELEDRIREIVKDCIAEAFSEQSDNDILTPREVEKLLDISHTTRIDWTSQGMLKAYSIGGHKKYYKRSEIIQALKKIH